MAAEIERKFMVSGDGWRDQAEGVPYFQGYIHTKGSATVRLRLAGEQGILTIKGPRDGIRRSEFEYNIPYDEALVMLKTLCHQPIIEKTRYHVTYEGFVWDVDEMHGANEGLIMAEVEIEDESVEVPLPDWVGEEVSTDHRYTNLYLSQHPWSERE